MLPDIQGIEAFRVAYLLALVPTLSLFNTTFRLSEKMIPEIGDILHYLGRFHQSAQHHLLPKLINRLESWIRRING